MSQAQAKAWWTEVEHLREPAERRGRAEREARARRGAHDPPLGAATPHGPRRTVKIRGQAIPAVSARPLVEVPAPAPVHRTREAERDRDRRPATRRPRRRPAERIGARPDRIALWAFLVGLLLVVIAVLTAHGA
ncbi:MAG TPA: hypothetical protein VGN69_08590 [Solirubrobacteraceae bacterium]|jgi:hypothetical protein|nr:hypothetical protein [Solirubrobacteraceae bacterium]